jgi:glycosyltransferase involved in cell wall biosynthesis
MNKKKILWFTWKDKKNPLAGGAEIVNEELAKRLVQNGYEVKLIVGGYKDSTPKEIIDGYEVIRVGGRWTVYWQAYKYYKKNLQGWADSVIDEINTIPFFSKFYVKEKNILFIHQLCREIWFYQMFFPLNWIGYIIEPLYLRLLNDRKVITISNSTKTDLLKYGFKAANIQIISEGIEIEPVENLDTITKFDNPTILSLGSIRAMKRTKDILQAYNLAKQSIPNLELVIAGDSNDPYGQEFLQELEKSDYKQDIQYLGKVSIDKKIELMQKSHIILVTSVKEGWGLIVTEANSQGTPAIVYNVDGLRDSVIDNKTGLICSTNTSQTLADNIGKLFSDQTLYDKLRQESYKFSQSINFEQSYTDFVNIIK